jgi:hypothetical protein
VIVCQIVIPGDHLGRDGGNWASEDRIFICSLQQMVLECGAFSGISEDQRIQRF